MTEKEKMLKGMIYDGSDEVLSKERALGHKLSHQFNNTYECQVHKRKRIIDKLLQNHGKNCYIMGPIMIDYGKYTKVGDNFFANFNFTVLDTCPVTIGDNVFFGPNCSLMTPIHPMVASERQMHMIPNGDFSDEEYAKPIVIGNDCWIASNVVVCGGVTIGDGCVIGAGSVVTRDVPSGSFAAGNPCRVIRKITENDSIYNKPELWENGEMPKK